MVLAADRYVALLEAPTSERIDGATLELPVDLRAPPLAIVSVAFDPPLHELALDEPSADVEVVAAIDEEGVVRGAPGLPIALSNEKGDSLGIAPTSPSGHARFRVDASRLGAVGPGALRAIFAGSATAGASACTTAVERRAHVDLGLPAASTSGPSPRLPPGSAEDGIAIEVTAVLRCAAAGCTGAPTGTVEARVGDAVVGAAPLADGRALLPVTFVPSAAEVPLRIAYLPDAPWLVAGPEIVATLPARESSPWKKVGLAIAGAATIACLALGRAASWKASPRPAAGGERDSSKPPVPHVEVLEALPVERGWTGIVVDAHDATPIASARVAIERPGFDRVHVIAETRSADDGAFAIARVESAPGDAIVAEGSTHAQLRDALPGSSRLRVALVLRRRALVDRLVEWAKKKGRPFDARPDPTPGHVRRAAGGDSPVGRWADAVERAAFGGTVVDGPAQAAVDRLAPPTPAREAEAPERAEARRPGEPVPRAR